MIDDIDIVGKQILFAVAESQKIKIGDLEKKVRASRQTIWNRVNVLVAVGYLKEERDRFPPTRWLELTDKGYQLLQMIRVLDSISASQFFTVRQTIQDLLAMEPEYTPDHLSILEHFDAYSTQQLTPEELKHILQPIIGVIAQAGDRPFQLVLTYSPTSAAKPEAGGKGLSASR